MCRSSKFVRSRGRDPTVAARFILDSCCMPVVCNHRCPWSMTSRSSSTVVNVPVICSDGCTVAVPQTEFIARVRGQSSCYYNNYYYSNNHNHNHNTNNNNDTPWLFWLKVFLCTNREVLSNLDGSFFWEAPRSASASGGVHLTRAHSDPIASPSCVRGASTSG